MTPDCMLQLVYDALDDDHEIESVVDEGVHGQLLAYDVDGDRWTVTVRPL